MEKGPLIGAGLMAIAVGGVVVFYIAMSSGDTGEVLDAARTTHQVEALKDATVHEVVGTRVEERPEDMVDAVIKGEWKAEAHGQVSGDDWDEIKAVRAAKDRRQLEGEVEAFIAPLDVDKTKMRAMLEELHIKREAVHVEVRDGFLNPRQARKQHAAINKETEAKLIEILGAEQTAALQKRLAKKRIRLF